uniref:Panurgine K n=1 Tax=Panurgus calcaratus TaxID=156354 RepID=PNGK_PANCL|nr:RecName: Full=Panurgine K; Short=PNG-K [Panurgus calcaratus]
LDVKKIICVACKIKPNPACKKICPK